MTNKKAKNKKKKKAKNKPAKKRQPPLTNAMVKAWGFECDNLVDAAVKYKGNLIDRLTRSKALRNAWDRGRFLRTLGDLVLSGTSQPDIAVELDIDAGKFDKFIAGDIEAADIWWRSRRELRRRVNSGVVDAACVGKKEALKSVERILNEGRSDPIGINFRVNEGQMMSITGVSRQTLHKWRTERIMPFEGDGTYDLRKVWQWFEGFSQRKVNVTPQIGAEDSLRELKAVQLKDRIDVDRGKLIERDKVIAGYVGRTKWDLEFWDRNIDGVTDKCANMPKAGVREILDKFQDQRRLELSKVEIEMKLTDKQHKRLESFLKELE